MGKFADLTGKRFGRYTVICEAERPPGKNNRHYWLCRCECGTEKVLDSASINKGAVVSCGCYQRERASKRAYEQHLTHGKTGSRLYNVWMAMKARCFNPNVKAYPLYGGRGIRVCEEWTRSFQSFSEWATSHGYDETQKRGCCTIDRINVDGDYSPENCRIATQKQQCLNRRSNRRLTFNGETKTISEWSAQYGMSIRTLSDRLSYGWDIERCLTQPLRHW